jgi:hypothetical protein
MSLKIVIFNSGNCSREKLSNTILIQTIINWYDIQRIKRLTINPSGELIR